MMATGSELRASEHLAHYSPFETPLLQVSLVEIGPNPHRLGSC